MDSERQSSGTIAETGAAKATRREWIGLGVLSIACLIYSMDLSVLFLAMPAIVTDLDPSPTELLWINDIYGFMVAGFLVTMGTLGDRFGRRRVLLIGAFAFGVASAFAAFAATSGQLILARAFLGIAGATIAPSTLSLVVNLFPDEGERTRAIGIWGTAFSLGGLVGPLIGGLLLEHFHWGAVFLINIPIMAALLAIAPVLLPEYRDTTVARIDIISVALSLLSVLPVIYGLKHMAASGFAADQLLWIGGGLLVGLLFIRRQKQLENPLLDLQLFQVPAFTASLVVNLAGVFFIFGVFLYENLYLQLVLGLTPLEAALWGMPPALVFTIMSMQAWRVTGRLGPVRTVLLGLVVNAVGTAAMAIAAYHQNLYAILAASMVIGAGFVPVILTTTGLIVGTAPPERAGSASAISETSAEFGGALGVAVLGSIGTVIYRIMMQSAELGGLDETASQAVRATLAGAVETTRLLGMTTPPGWLTEARAAFAAGFVACCVLASITLLVLAALSRAIYARANITAATVDHPH
ncbi:MFS transporter [Rhizobium sp. SG2393]|uniref:MFS transporter n=1 Tax=Rhizobium sp. SG2393 TaxID=3276279 RepID=UPI00366C7631